MPIPATSAAAQVRAQAVEIGWSWPMRVVLGDRVGDLVERLEPRFHPVGHEVVYPVRAGRIHVGHDVHQDDRAGNSGRNLSREKHCREPAEGCAHQHRLRRHVTQHFLDVEGKAGQAIIATFRPIGIAMAA